MAAKELLVDLSQIDLNRVVADLEEIRRYNPQRFEMEQLSAIIYENPENMTCVGYKDITDGEFWVRGHMPSIPLMPGVIMLEAAAQLCGFFAQKYDLLGAKMLGFGGLEDVRFRDPVRPGNRFYVLCKLEKIRRGRMIISHFQGVVGDNLVVEGIVKGIPLPLEILGPGGPG